MQQEGGRYIKKLIVIFWLFLVVFVLTACSNLSKNTISEVEIIQDDNSIHTFTKEGHSKELSILIKAANKVKNQRGEVDMPPSDYSLEFKIQNGETQIYSLWLDSDSAFLLENTTSDYVQLSSSYAENLIQIVTEHHANGITTFNVYFLVAGIPILILLLMLVDMFGTGTRKSRSDKA
ncbi:hypothetical protein [Ornithinibacillus scapharcae]|uniref:hypothetical protein n=1 Tax=Ornithinibacillus scapharcae TaxID=1147159 RepID=UPI000225B99D|nr:hypothetical protein [Ornithinibacillus scapharcae]